MSSAAGVGAAGASCHASHRASTRSISRRRARCRAAGLSIPPLFAAPGPGPAMGSAGLRAASALPPRAAAAAGEGRRQGRRKRGGELHSVPRCSAEDGGGGLRSAPPGREAGGTPLRAASRCRVRRYIAPLPQPSERQSCCGRRHGAERGSAAAAAAHPCAAGGGGGGGGGDANEGGGARAPPVLGAARERGPAAAPVAIPARSLCVARAGAG